MTPRLCHVRWTLLLVLPLLVLQVGCGGPSMPQVTGKVLFKDQPASGAMVIFHPVGDKSINAVKPYGTVEGDGTFRLTTRDPSLGVRDGILPGEYGVTVYWPKPPAAAGQKQKISLDGGEREEEASRLPAKYSSPETSGLRATITSSTTKLEPIVLR